MKRIMALRAPTSTGTLGPQVKFAGVATIVVRIAVILDGAVAPRFPVRAARLVVGLPRLALLLGNFHAALGHEARQRGAQRAEILPPPRVVVGGQGVLKATQVAHVIVELRGAATHFAAAAVTVPASRLRGRAIGQQER
jgi:hypothetical protein